MVFVCCGEWKEWEERGWKRRGVDEGDEMAWDAEDG